jgi:hypothetical protein
VAESAHIGTPRQSNYHAWVDNARWPHTELYSNLENVAIPSDGREYERDPERSAFRHSQHLLPRVDEMSEEEMSRAWRRMFD